MTEPLAETLDRDRLRSAIRAEYEVVAANPEQAFHFHTGRKLAELLGYREDWLLAAPADALASFAGTGNPLLAGEVEPGDRVVTSVAGRALT
jgi:hypothetical protein